MTCRKIKSLQSGASSLAKQGGAYFSAVCGSIQDPIAAPGPYENQEPQKLVGIASAPTLFTTSTKHHGSHGVDCRISPFEDHKYLSGNKSL